MTHSFRVGELLCRVVSDGELVYPTSALIVDAPQEELEALLRQHGVSVEQMSVPYDCLLVETGRHRVLLDTGAGPLAPSTGKLMENLREAGVEPESIDVVGLSHGHADHIGGISDAEGKPTFPKARFVMWKGEWDFWTAESTLEKLARCELYHLGELEQMIGAWARRYLPAIEDRVERIEWATEIVPGIQAIPAFGHTPGHGAFVVSSGGEELLFVGDALVHPIHVAQPSWGTVFDLSRAEAAATRRSLLERAAAKNSLVMGYHWPYPSLGRVMARGMGWRWDAG